MPLPLPERIVGSRLPMSWRAKTYLWVNTLRALPVAYACISAPHLFDSQMFVYLRSALPLEVWGAALIVSALLSAAASLLARETLARLALILSASLALSWSVSLAFAAARGSLVSPLGITWGLALACKDLIVCRQPLWSPFEPLVREVIKEPLPIRHLEIVA